MINILQWSNCVGMCTDVQKGQTLSKPDNLGSPDSARSLLVLCEYIALITDKPFACRHLRPVLQTVWLSDDMHVERIYLNFTVVQNSLLGRMLQRACVEVIVLVSVFNKGKSWQYSDFVADM
jgi:hypothetical protein